mmetsp:Transcript_15234/g.38742  ORF Transcript_15234/g.38742 Transcript_15234/m.38742 type:complete len:338 (+) Transcript_15234:96-1109(+)
MAPDPIDIDERAQRDTQAVLEEEKEAHTRARTQSGSGNQSHSLATHENVDANPIALPTGIEVASDSPSRVSEVDCRTPLLSPPPSKASSAAAAAGGAPGSRASASSASVMAVLPRRWAQSFASRPVNMLVLFTCASMILYLDRGTIASSGVNGSLDTRSCVPSAACQLKHGKCVPITNGTTGVGFSSGDGIDTGLGLGLGIGANAYASVHCEMEGSAKHGFQGDFGLSSSSDGWLQSLFLVGLLVASPLFAHAAKEKDNANLCAYGLLLWSVAVILCGFSFDFWSLAICRTCVGVGEAALIAIVPNFIDTCAPKSKKGKWLGIYCMAIPCGTALGYV